MYKIGYRTIIKRRILPKPLLVVITDMSVEVFADTLVVLVTLSEIDGFLYKEKVNLKDLIAWERGV